MLTVVLVALGASSRSFGQTIPDLPLNFLQSQLQNLQSNTGGTAVQAGNTSTQKVARQVAIDPLEKARQDSIKAAQTQVAKASKELDDLRKSIYGYTIFNNKNPLFQENLRVATPKTYVIGPDDELIIDISGYNATTYKLTVTPDGYVAVGSMVGNVYVNGLTLEEAKERLRNRFARIYAGLNNNTSAIFVSLGNIRSIRVTLLGEVINPGTYSISSLSTVMNALYMAGGPSETGSFRDIQVIRNNKVISRLDIYDILTTGTRQSDIRLEDQDVIRIPTFQTRVTVQGRVKRPGLYEMLPTEKLDRCIQYAGGFGQDAYSARLKVFRNTDRERKILEVSKAKLGEFDLKDGDVVRIDTILTRYENMVRLVGAVYRPGQYSIEESPTLMQLLKNADGLRDEAFTARINIVRLNDDLTFSNLAVNLADVLNGKAQDISLKREDEVIIKSKQDLTQEFTVRIQGAVNYDPRTETGFYQYRKGMTIEDLILAAGGLQESASPFNVEVARRKRDATSAERSTQVTEILKFTIDKNLPLNEQANKFVLEPFDEVYIRFAPNYEAQQNVLVEGQVLMPGTYALKTRLDRISDVIQRANGLSDEAYADGATLFRKVKLTKKEIEARRKTITEISNDNADTEVKVDDVNEEKEEQIGINLAKALSQPGSEDDLILQEGDVIQIPKKLMTVRISGEVLYPTSTRYQSGHLLDYISAAGGYTGKSIRSRSFVRHANGTVERTRRFLCFNNYPKVKPGSEIVVPAKTKNDLTAFQIVQNIQGLLVGLTSISTLVISLIALRR
jgi:protein involved in polysaccharide export with SLBB domain